MANLAKQAVGKAAADLIEDGMALGLGTGSTAACFIDSLIERCRKGLNVTAVATSERSRKQAQEGGIPLLDVESVTSLDLVVDGADEVDREKQLIKGGGGALLYEKIIASSAKEMLVIVDANKLVRNLGTFPLPIEITPFYRQSTIRRLEEKGFHGQLRRLGGGSLYVTDGGHNILDVRPDKGAWQNPEKAHLQILQTPGVIETGFFIGLAGRVLVGHENGQVNFLGDEKANSFLH